MKVEHANWFSLRIAVTLIVVVAPVICRRARAADVVSLETVAAALQSQLSSIRSIDVVYEVSPGGTTEPPPGAAAGTNRVEWAEQGDCLLSEEFSLDAPNHLSRAITFDGHRGFLFYEIPATDSAPPAPPQMEITNAVSSLYAGMPVIGFVYSKHGWPTAPTIPELILLPSSTLLGEETILDRKCCHIDVGKVEGPSGQPIKISLYLDNDRDFLPARIVWRYDIGNSQADRFVETMDIKEYMRVHDAVGGTNRWFPRLATRSSEILGTKIITVKSVTINQPLPVERFRPNAPNGTSVTDRTSEDKPKLYIVGGQAAQQALIKQAADEVKIKLNEALAAQETTGAVIDARPTRGYRIVPWLLIVMAVVCFSVAFFRFRRT